MNMIIMMMMRIIMMIMIMIIMIILVITCKSLSFSIERIYDDDDQMMITIMIMMKTQTRIMIISIIMVTCNSLSFSRSVERMLRKLLQSPFLLLHPRPQLFCWSLPIFNVCRYLSVFNLIIIYSADNIWIIRIVCVQAFEFWLAYLPVWRCSQFPC